MTVATWTIAALIAALFSIDSAPSATADDELEALYAKGITYDAFLDTVVRRRQMWVKNDARAKVDESVLERARAVEGQWRLLAVAEDWCSDSANILPYLAELVDALENLELRVIGSEAGAEIMEAHKTPDGRAATPTILLLDAEYNKKGCLIERPAEMQTWALEKKAELGDKEFVRQKLAWYNRDKGRLSIEEVVGMLEAATAGNGGC